MFDKNMMKKNSLWVNAVTEEILTRCSNALIYHVAVDAESVEGCVYIKTKNTDEAAKVFRTLHGQWYRGNLVTAKYLRDERYYERFPAAKMQNSPMRPLQELNYGR
jgi:membrane protein Man1